MPLANTDFASSGEKGKLVDNPLNAKHFKKCLREIMDVMKVSKMKIEHDSFRNCRTLRALGVSIAIMVVRLPSLRGDNIAYLYALEADAIAVKQQCTSGIQVLKIGDVSVSRLAIAEHTVYLAKLGVGCVQTAMVTQAVLAKIKCDYLITTGPVGSLSSEWKIGEWGQVESITPYQRGNDTPNGFVLSSDSIELPIPKSEMWRPKEITRKMRVASGETFSASDVFRDKLFAQNRGDVIDMNLFGLVSVAASHRIPLVAWRVVSDNAGDSATDEFSAFIREYNGIGGKWVAEWIKRLPQNPANPESYDKLRELIRK